MLELTFPNGELVNLGQRQPLTVLSLSRERRGRCPAWPRSLWIWSPACLMRCPHERPSWRRPVCPQSSTQWAVMMSKGRRDGCGQYVCPLCLVLEVSGHCDPQSRKAPPVLTGQVGSQQEGGLGGRKAGSHLVAPQGAICWGGSKEGADVPSLGPAGWAEGQWPWCPLPELLWGRHHQGQPQAPKGSHFLKHISDQVPTGTW